MVSQNDEVEVALGDEDLDEALPLKYSISSYGADYPVDSLVKRLQAGDVFIPEFQREYVWTVPKASRFVESLLLGLPVPGIFLSREAETQRMLVIDGQQRLQTLRFFYEGIFGDTGREFSLAGLKSAFEGLTYRNLEDEDRRRLDDSIIHATVVRQEEPSEDDSSIYFVFERLNTGGMQLVPQEIRACIYHGRFNDLLNELNQNDAWRHVFGNVSKRMRDRELILRFLAMYYRSDEYSPPMKDFLNFFMGSNRDLGQISGDEMRDKFIDTIRTVSSFFQTRPFRPQRTLNAAVFDAVMVGLAKRLDDGPLAKPEALNDAYLQLVSDEDFKSATETGTTQEANVRTRIECAIGAFASLD